ncbi:hypothetical protein K9N68_39895 (plasmid) [Kovacikia minuta CCNUW1]|uniref:plasmid mobilization protein n=1 Tax=Kovacikia minuta TaxID=2931930 RepID=UPI001CCFFAF6|nr:hypothetical protein [Kovacikia minuta]UBF30761.1 hypothetical protein K9N68_39895 [Kovacikia minuta CCNUW1]
MTDPEIARDRQDHLAQLRQLMAPILPPLLEPETEMLTCRVPAKEHQALKAWCQEQGLPLSDYVRSRLYDRPLPRRQPKERLSSLDRQVIVALNGLSTSLNQTVRRLNQQDSPELTESDRQLLQILQTQLKEIQTQLRGGGDP